MAKLNDSLLPHALNKIVQPGIENTRKERINFLPYVGTYLSLARICQNDASGIHFQRKYKHHFRAIYSSFLLSI